MPSAKLEIANVEAWEALDSRGNPTIACRVTLAGGGIGRAIVPAGASTGRHEAREWRDGGERMAGLGVRGAVEMIETHIRPTVVGCDTSVQATVDGLLRTIAPPPDRGYLGSNTTLAVSVAAARAGADGLGIPLWSHLDRGEGTPLLPMPMIQILAGGVHAGRVIDLQDVLVIPTAAGRFAEAIEMVWRVRAAAIADANIGGHAVQLVGDEGGLAIPFRSNRAAVEFVARAIDHAGLEGDVGIAIDVAAGQLVDETGSYQLSTEGRTLNRDEWIGELGSWVTELPLISIEDPLDDDDWEGWQHACAALQVAQLVGDDLFVTDLARVERGLLERAATCVLVKPNQCGTLTEAAVVVQVAQEAGLRTVVSARSGESEDDWLADLAVGWRAGQVKVGSLTRSDRTAKWNRLLELEATGPLTVLASPFST